MELKKEILFIICLIGGILPVFSQKGTVPKQRNRAVITVPKEKFHLYLLIGQSNMAGRGEIEPQDTIENRRILRLNKNGDWEIAKEPLQFDKSFAGVGPGMAFAKTMLTPEDDVVIGLIPCAAGGSSIDIWLRDLFWDQTKSTPYNNALIRTKLAMKDGTLKGILWHQGEADCNSRNVEAYKNKLELLIKKLRNEFNAPVLPFIAGELPEFNQFSERFNAILEQVKPHEGNYGVVSGKGLTSNLDGIHLDGSSARKLGIRYAEKMKQLLKEKQ
ncbi:sialate O-acetylesterase [Bacteroides ovatus]|uniref:sialate O-acetylesterase n=1 Tax=Bacteroides ovatus TaxID=28116 RepID=UPI00321BFB0B